MSEPVRVVILNAYRRENAGDGLLVDQTAAIIREALPDAQLTLVSMAPEGFAEFADGMHPIGGRRGGITRRGLVARMLTGRAHPDVIRAIRHADLAVAVGGGYLRAETVTAAMKSYLSHMVQAPLRRGGTPYLYFPQSVGPLPPGPLPFGIRRLRRAAAFHVRDDRSQTELARRGVPTTRTPDLAILAMGELGNLSHEGSWGRPVLVARALRGDDSAYRQSLDKLRDLADLDIAVQSRGAGNDDPTFYRSMGWGVDPPRLLDLLDGERPPKIVVSVRLHGSLQSILSGIPSVHLSYERKGWGAYEDLGIGEYVHHAWHFDPYLVADQIAQLQESSTDYWRRIGTRIESFRAARQALVEEVRSTVRRPRAHLPSAERSERAQ